MRLQSREDAMTDDDLRERNKLLQRGLRSNSLSLPLP